MKNVTIKQLRAFVSVAREGSFTRAASSLNLSQSALTIAIRQLEAELNVKLFDRTTRSVILTDHAALLLPVVERLLQDLWHSLDDLSAIALRQKGNVAAAASASFLCCILAPIAAKMRHSFPGIHVKLLNMPDNLTKRLQEEEIDFGVTNVGRVPHGLESFPLLEDSFGVVCPVDHPLAAKRRPLVWKDLAGASMVSMPAGTRTRDILDGHPDISRLLDPPVCEASSIFALGAMIRHGMGIAPVTALVSRVVVSEELVFLPLREPIIRRELFVVKRKGRSLSPAAVEVLNYMMDELGAYESEDVILKHKETYAPSFQ